MNYDVPLLPEHVLRKASDVLKTEIPEDTKQEIREMIMKDPERWCVPYHFFWGMAIRNLLRRAGLKDDLLPTGNWDDYYIQCIEEAVRC